MVNIFYTANYSLDLFSFLLTLFISYYSFKIYKVTHRRNEKVLTISFLLMSLSLLTKLLTNFLSNYYRLGFNVDLLYPGTILFNIILLTAYTTLDKLVLKIKKIELFTLQFLIILYATLLSLLNSFLFFDVTGFILLTYPVAHFYKNAFSRKKKNSLLIAISFTSLMFSHLAQILQTFGSITYMDNVLRLFGFLMLAIAMWKIRK